MKNTSQILPVLVLVVVLVVGLGPGPDPGLGLGPGLAVAAEPVYMGAKFCRTCHSSADKDRYHLWLQSGHAQAFEALKGAEKADPQCLSCHSTGYGKPFSEKTTEKDLRGVQCEACHGPGSEYKSMRVMKNPTLARKMGLVDVTRDTCLKCHR